MTLYPWRGEFTVGSETSQIAVDTLASRLDFPKEKVAIWGQHKTENLGIEKIMANIVSNPKIRYLVICGEEVRGHRSGDSIIALHANGIDDNGRIIGAKGAVPYIENLPADAIARFREQVEIVDMIGTTSLDEIVAKIEELANRSKDPIGEPIIIEFVERQKGSQMTSLEGKIALHKDLIVGPYLEVEEMTLEADS
jgi:tetrahydromethanopterin S-methyltransferase subunit A